LTPATRRYTARTEMADKATEPTVGEPAVVKPSTEEKLPTEYKPSTAGASTVTDPVATEAGGAVQEDEVLEPDVSMYFVKFRPVLTGFRACDHRIPIRRLEMVILRCRCLINVESSTTDSI